MSCQARRVVCKVTKYQSSSSKTQVPSRDGTPIEGEEHKIDIKAGNKKEKLKRHQ
jgi:hypothetical protein